MSQIDNLIELIQNDIKSLDRNCIFEVFSLIADGIYDDSKVKKLLLTINKVGISDKILLPVVEVFNKKSIKLNAPNDAIDVCGTGGDYLNTLNISTAVSFVVASCGVTVAKHGNKSVSSLSGSADIFSELGIDIYQSKKNIEQSLIDNQLAFIFAPIYHPAFKNIVNIRKQIKDKTIFNYVGPLLNPAQVKYQLIGCTDKNIAQNFAKTLTKNIKKKKLGSI